MNNLNQNRIDLLLQYILVVAGQESGWDRELGMIHLIKYAYLADLTYSKYQKGETYTGLPWKFYHFGPWSVELYNRIEPALQEIEPTKRVIESPKYDKDFARWSISDDRLFDELGNRLDLSVMGAVQRDVRLFGTDTRALLDYVYKTEPMIMAAPGELLNFNIAENQIKEIEEKTTEVEKSQTLTAKQIKKRTTKIINSMLHFDLLSTWNY